MELGTLSFAGRGRRRHEERDYCINNHLLCHPRQSALGRRSSGNINNIILIYELQDIIFFFLDQTLRYTRTLPTYTQHGPRDADSDDMDDRSGRDKKTMRCCWWGGMKWMAMPAVTTVLPILPQLHHLHLSRPTSSSSSSISLAWMATQSTTQPQERGPSSE